MTPARMLFLSRAFLAGCFIVAGVCMRPHPFVAIAALAVGSLQLLLTWHRTRGAERALVAARCGDVATLRRIAGGIPPASVSALVALAIFDGVAYVEALPEHEICRCERANCSIHFLNDEMRLYLAILRDSEEGRWRRHVNEVVARGQNLPTTGLQGQLAAYLNSLRASALSFGMLHGGGGKSRADVERVLKPTTSRNVLGSAIRFAAALRLKQLGEIEASRTLLASLPPWKPGSKLAAERTQLERELASSR